MDLRCEASRSILTPAYYMAPFFLNILVVEDNPGDLYLIQEYLSNSPVPFEVFNTKTLAETREAVQFTRFDVILLDLTLPDKMGKELIEEVIKLASATPIIILTGYSDEQFGVESLKLGVQDYLVKDEVSSSILFKSINYSIERAKTQAQLLESHKRYELVSNATNDMVWDWDLVAGNIYRSKRGWQRIFGNRIDEEHNQPDAFKTRIHPDDEGITSGFLDGFLAKPSSVTFEHEFRMRRDDGTYAYVIDKGYLVRDEQGKPVRLIGALQDITGRKLSEIAVQLKEQRFRHLVQSGNDMISILDAKGTYTYLSPSVSTVLGYGEDHLLGLNVFDLVHPDDLATLKSEVHKLTDKKFVELSPFRFPDVQGEYRWLECKVTNHLEAPAVHGIVVNSRDITQRKQRAAEKEKLIEELTLYNQDLKQFSFITSHNLRAPLSNLQGILNILDTSEIASRETLHLIEGLRKSTSQLSETINDLVNILIIKQNTSLVKENLSFQQSFDNVTNMLQGILAHESPVVSTCFEHAPSVFFHKSYLESIFLNLLTNSIKYKSPSRELKLNLSSEEEEGYIVLSFSDNGLGIDTSKFGSRIFGLYQRFHSVNEGKGIGLYMVHSQMTALGGKVSVESEPDKGTTFKLHFKHDKQHAK